MKKITLLAILAFLILSTCKKDDENNQTPEPDPAVYLAEITIDATGGTLTSDEFEMIIPAGAFTESSDLKLSKNENDKPFDEEQVSSLYVLEGLPEVIQEPLTVSIKTGSKAKEDYFIAVGEDNFISSLDTVETSYYLLPADVDSEWLNCEIPAMDSEGEKSVAEGNSFKLTFTALGNYQYFGEGTHFLIYTPPSLFQEAEALHTNLEGTYEFFQTVFLTFSYENRTKWPVTVTIKQLKSNVYGVYANSKWGDNYGYMEFNRAHMNDAEQMEITAGHEFFHLVQSLYDPRGAYTQAVTRPEWHWLNEACAVWSEFIFTDDEDYTSQVRHGNQMAPFEGAIQGAQSETGHHGYGMSAAIEYIIQEFYGLVFPLNLTYEKIADGGNSVDALGTLNNGQNPPATVWNIYSHFLEEYVMGELYNDVNPSFWVGNVEGTFKIEDNGDTVKSFTNQYPQLSGKLFNIELNYPDLDNQAYLECEIPGDEESFLTVFRYQGSQIEKAVFIGSYAKLDILNLKWLMDEGWNLLALVTNNEMEAPYLSSRNLELTLKVKKPDISLPPIVSFHFGYDGYFKWISGDTVTYYEPGGWNRYVMIRNGVYNGEQYVATWDTVDIDNYHHRGSLTADIDFENQEITSLHIRDMMNSGFIKDTIAFTIINIPSVSWDENYKFFEIDGSGIYYQIPYLYFKREAYGNTQNLTGYNCNVSCHFDLEMKTY